MASKYDFAYHLGMSSEFKKVRPDYVKGKVTGIDAKSAQAKKTSDKEMIGARIKKQFKF